MTASSALTAVSAGLCMILALPAVQAFADSLGASDGSFAPGAIIGRMGSPSRSITLSYDNTLMTTDAAEDYARRDCADYDKTLGDLTHTGGTTDAPHLSSATYTCR